MYYGATESVKDDELKWKKALQRRLLDSGHDGSSLRLFGIIALAVILLVTLIVAVSYASNTNSNIMNSVMGISEVASPRSNVIAVVPNNDSKTISVAVNAVSENIITADEEEKLIEKNEQKSEQQDTGNLQVISQKQIQNGENEVQVAFQKASTSAPVVLLSKSFCPFCTEIKKILLPYNKNVEGEKIVNVIELDKDPNGRLLLDGIEQIVGRRSVPQAFISGEYYGGLRAVKEAEESGELSKLVEAARMAFNSKTVLEE